MQKFWQVSYSVQAIFVYVFYFCIENFLGHWILSNWKEIEASPFTKRKINCLFHKASNTDEHIFLFAWIGKLVLISKYVIGKSSKNGSWTKARLKSLFVSYDLSFASTETKFKIPTTKTQNNIVIFGFFHKKMILLFWLFLK